MFKSNFIIVQLDTDYYRATWSDALDLDDAKLFFGLAPNNFLLQALARIQQSAIVNKLFHPPFKGIWHKRFVNLSFKDNLRPLIFIFNADVLRCSGNFLMLLRQDFPSARFVVFYTDLMITKSKDVYPNKLRNFIDLFITFDRNEAEKYGIDYFPTVFSDIKLNVDESIPECDLFYLGIAKEGRVKILEGLFNQCMSEGIKCNFNVIVSNKSEKDMPPGIHSIKRMSYLDNLKYVQKAKCILELVQDGAVGSTLRMWEAINYGKAIITNNKDIVNSNYYLNSFVSLLDHNNHCDVNFIKAYKPHENSLKNKLIRPATFLEYIQNKLL